MLTSAPREFFISESFSHQAVSATPQARDKLLVQSPQVCHHGAESGSGDLCSLSQPTFPRHLFMFTLPPVPLSKDSDN